MRSRISVKRIIHLTVLLAICYLIIAHYEKKFPGRIGLLTDYNETIRRRIHYTKYLYSDYDKFIQIYGNDIEKIENTPLQDKCNTFFNHFLKENPDWTFPIYNNPGNRIDKIIDDKQRFFKDRSGKESDKSKIEQEYSQAVDRTIDISQKMADTASLMRIYGKCFLNKPENNRYNQLTQLFFPFLTTKLPSFKVVTEPSSTDLPENTWPVFDKKSNELISSRPTQSNNLVSTILENIKGKGIVISGSNTHTREIMRLIRVLRALNNKLPIQIVHSGELSAKSVRYIEAVAISDIDFLLDPRTSEYKYLKHIDLLNNHEEYGSHFPKQHLTFVNIKPSINREHKNAFPGYSNRLLALLFSTFEEIIMLDCDTVPLVPVETFFQSKQYKSSGTFYFQDRTLRDYNDFFETNLLTSLFPANVKSLDSLFNISQITSKTLNNRFMTGWRHYQEAGVVVINKRQHYLGVLMTLPLSLWKEPMKSMIWGDKEMYWVGLSMAGDENYEFNPIPAATVGQLTTDSKRKYYPNSNTSELCSSHPGHIDEHGKLLWINSGFSYCKKNGYYRDKSKFPYSTFDVTELSQLYESPIRITSGIVPPDLPRYRQPGSPVDISPEINFKQSWKLRKLDIDEINNNVPNEEKVQVIENWDPQRGWIKSDICSGYYYCAYDKIDNYFETGMKDKGKVYMFNDEDIRMLDYLGKVWHTGGTRRFLEVPK
ncbi:putative alpha-13-mannosyltransferase MNN15 [Spathaspora sp. JA1]|nr:putative alpha-13-mannosyltransferase MNN15 [Spathaspora sp. JA1]